MILILTLTAQWEARGGIDDIGATLRIVRIRRFSIW